MSPSGLHKRLLPCLLGVVLAAFSALSALPPVHAQGYGVQQTPPGREDLPDHALLLRQEVNRNAVITLRNGQTMRGMIMEVDASEITLALDAATMMEARIGISWLQVEEVRVERHARILEGLLLGGAGGALLGTISPDDSGIKRDILGIEAPEEMWDTALQGAVIGAVAGLIRGMDVMLAPTHQTFSATGLYRPDTAQVRPAVRFINTAPTSSMTSRDIEESLQAGPLGVIGLMRSDNTWNGHRGATMAVETSWPSAEGRWWLRSRIEWTTLARIGLPEIVLAGDPAPTELWREYSAVRSLIGVVYPLGSTGRLPLAEIAVMGGLSRTTLSSHASHEEPPEVDPLQPFQAHSKQKVYRPLLMASGSLALVRQPKLAIFLRAEGVMGAGFKANALINDAGEVIIPKHRITPIGLSIGIEVLFPNF
ncbi:hypothetical protein ACFL3H_09405 [Gemmatimonadota bacterium]